MDNNINEFLQRPDVLDICDDDYLSPFVAGRIIDLVAAGAENRLYSLLSKWRQANNPTSVAPDHDMLESIQDWLGEIQRVGLAKAEVALHRLASICELHDVSLEALFEACAVTDSAALYTRRWYSKTEDGEIIILGLPTDNETCIGAASIDKASPGEIEAIKSAQGRMRIDIYNHRPNFNLVVPSTKGLEAFFQSGCLIMQEQSWAIFSAGKQLYTANIDYVRDIQAQSAINSDVSIEIIKSNLSLSEALEELAYLNQ